MDEHERDCASTKNRKKRNSSSGFAGALCHAGDCRLLNCLNILGVRGSIERVGRCATSKAGVRVPFLLVNRRIREV
jgi:hypothetical protein